MDYYIDQTTGRMAISGGKIREVTDGVEEMKQRIIIALKTHQGECLDDVTRGLPWTSEILVKGPDLAKITNRVRAYLLTIEGVTGVRSCEVALVAVTRTMTIDLDVETTAGVTGPFRVAVAY